MLLVAIQRKLSFICVRFGWGFKGELFFWSSFSYLTLFDLRYCDGKVSLDLVAAATFLKDTLDKEGIQELISNLSKYKGEQCFKVAYMQLHIQWTIFVSCRAYVFGIIFNSLKLLPVKLSACVYISYNFKVDMADHV